MKKILMYLLTLLTFFGCQDNIQSNLPALQGLKNGDFTWRSSASTVVVGADATLKFTGTDGYGTLTLELPTTAVGTFPLGENTTALVTYSEDEFTYSTKNSGNDSIVYVSDGSIMIDELNTITGTITGTFYFNAYTANGERVMNFSEGVIYKLPVTEGSL